MKIKLTLKIPLKTPYKGIKLQQLERFLQKKKKTRFHGGISLKFLGDFKNAFWHFWVFKL
ncbi:hypothetical protein N205_07635 [Helicobacter pylori UM077]|nr:hypothetical protein [Helicobacter pylori]EPZ95170.1 hypothetical protein N205_07635 [Helicobacter pylori UM077]